ncbi:MAG: hypothetical protein IID05_00140 [Gemmatimonadetes bacterium]|nr:hypothetical protein [Gemmatimonadota bacterium]
MRFVALVLTSSLITTAAAVAQDADRTVTDGGIKVAGWNGRIDRRALSQGMTIASSRFAETQGGFRLSTGPAGNFWNDGNVASGDYEVKATFNELEIVSPHAHPYGIFIGGANLESDTETLLYCIVYSTGQFSVKMFHGATVTTLVNREANAALHKADADGASTNEIGWRVSGGKAACVVNGTEVASFDMSEVVGDDKIASTDGVYGIRVSHNIELTVTGLTMTSH